MDKARFILMHTKVWYLTPASVMHEYSLIRTASKSMQVENENHRVYIFTFQ